MCCPPYICQFTFLCCLTCYRSALSLCAIVRVWSSRIAGKRFVELNACGLRAGLALLRRLGGARMACNELRAVGPSLKVFACLPARQHDIFARLIARAQHLKPAKTRHAIHTASALSPALLEASRCLLWHTHMKQAHDHRFLLLRYPIPPDDWDASHTMQPQKAQPPHRMIGATA